MNKNEKKQLEAEKKTKQNRQNLNLKVYKLLKKHERHLHEDLEYKQVMGELAKALEEGEIQDDYK